jgi:predicted ester cyclase
VGYGHLYALLKFPDPVVHTPAVLSTNGLESERESWRRGLAAMPDLHHEFIDVLVTPTLEAARTVVTGTFQGAYGGLTAHGRRFEIDQALFAHICDGKISDLWEMVDIAALKAQLSGE